MADALTPAIIYPLLIWIIGVALTMLLLWLVVRSAVKRALWDHHLRTARSVSAYRAPSISPYAGDDVSQRS